MNIFNFSPVSNPSIHIPACARDKRAFQLSGIEFTSSCTAAGAYQIVQQENDQYYCADSDGYAASPPDVGYTETECEGYFWYD